MCNTTADTAITATLVPETSRLDFLPRFFGKHMIGEAMVFNWADRLSADYNGGLWDFFTLSNGGFYLAPSVQLDYRVMWNLNSFDDTMGTDAFGIVVTLFALCHLAELTEDEPVIERYHALRDYAAMHAESRKIMRAID
ncbi:antirestriction protein [Paraburkholderia susongensis]|uniref:Antirestriction protein n=1 Tax=Paraburkholderia susongensis TaxID=1515439 RepID=A0A1X7M7A3_9BURK|nr:antirestriction protein [Paraburkholderia susongensis]SMG61587.1 Antirestriction protein [Paraburkholderia susongensis]